MLKILPKNPPKHPQFNVKAPRAPKSTLSIKLTSEKFHHFIIPNPKGYEVHQVTQDGWFDPRIKARYFLCPETFNSMAEVIIPENVEQTLLQVSFIHSTCLGMMHFDIYPPIRRTYLIKDNTLEEVKER